MKTNNFFCHALMRKDIYLIMELNIVIWSQRYFLVELKQVKKTTFHFCQIELIVLNF